MSATQTKTRQRAGGDTKMEFAEIPGTTLKCRASASAPGLSAAGFGAVRKKKMPSVLFVLHMIWASQASTQRLHMVSVKVKNW